MIRKKDSVVNGMAESEPVLKKVRAKTSVD